MPTRMESFATASAVDMAHPREPFATEALIESHTSGLTLTENITTAEDSAQIVNLDKKRKREADHHVESESEVNSEGDSESIEEDEPGQKSESNQELEPEDENESPHSIQKSRSSDFQRPNFKGGSPAKQAITQKGTLVSEREITPEVGSYARTTLGINRRPNVQVSMGDKEVDPEHSSGSNVETNTKAALLIRGGLRAGVKRKRAHGADEMIAQIQREADRMGTLNQRVTTLLALRDKVAQLEGKVKKRQEEIWRRQQELDKLNGDLGAAREDLEAAKEDLKVAKEELEAAKEKLEDDEGQIKSELAMSQKTWESLQNTAEEIFILMDNYNKKARRVRSRFDDN